MSLAFVEINIPKEVIKNYLEKRVGKNIKIKEYKRLGTGWHGTGYRIVYNDGKKDSIIILRTLRPEGFSHDYAADRAKVFLLQHSLSKKVPNHIKSIDVTGYTEKGELVSLGDCEEFFQIVELADGDEYVKDLLRLLKTGKLTEEDRKKALILSDYLVQLHKEKFNAKSGEERAMAASIYKRHTRDCVGDGEMLMGVLDTYPENLEWTDKKEFADIISRAVNFRQNMEDRPARLCRIHGDLHPGNIMFGRDGLRVLDASRELWGEPADDLTCITVNLIWYAIQQTGKFEGIFKELFDIIWNNYMEKTNDDELRKVAPLFFAFRSVVVAHPVFFPDQTDATRKKMFTFAKNVLSEKEFDVKKIDNYLK